MLGESLHLPQPSGRSTKTVSRPDSIKTYNIRKSPLSSPPERLADHHGRNLLLRCNRWFHWSGGRGMPPSPTASCSFPPGRFTLLLGVLSSRPLCCSDIYDFDLKFVLRRSRSCFPIRFWTCPTHSCLTMRHTALLYTESSVFWHPYCSPTKKNCKIERVSDIDD